MIGIPKEALLADVEHFARDQGLQEHLPLLRKGALCAQSPALFESIPELDETDREHLRVEVLHRWKHPKILYFTIIMNSIAAAIQGWDQTGSNGANLGFTQYFGIPDDPKTSNCKELGTCERNSWIIGFINASPYIAIAFL